LGCLSLTHSDSRIRALVNAGSPGLVLDSLRVSSYDISMLFRHGRTFHGVALADQPQPEPW